MDERFAINDYDLPDYDETEEEAMSQFYNSVLIMHKDHGNHGSLSFETCTNETCVMAREWKAEVEAAQHGVHLTPMGVPNVEEDLPEFGTGGWMSAR